MSPSHNDLVQLVAKWCTDTMLAQVVLTESRQRWGHGEMRNSHGTDKQVWLPLWAGPHGHP